MNSCSPSLKALTVAVYSEVTWTLDPPIGAQITPPLRQPITVVRSGNNPGSDPGSAATLAPGLVMEWTELWTCSGVWLEAVINPPPWGRTTSSACAGFDKRNRAGTFRWPNVGSPSDKHWSDLSGILSVILSNRKIWFLQSLTQHKCFRVGGFVKHGIKNLQWPPRPLCFLFFSPCVCVRAEGGQASFCTSLKSWTWTKASAGHHKPCWPAAYSSVCLLLGGEIR